MMVTLSGYQITQQLHESPNSKVYLGQQEQDHRPIVIKILQSEYPTPQQLVQFHNEYEFTKELNIEGIRKAVEVTEIEHKHALLLEYVAGETLKRTFVEQRHSLIDFLKVAAQIAQTLGEIHQHNIIHKDINAANILFDARQQQIKIIDFGLASRINLKSYHLGNPGRLEGTLAYISPEQTGRMNRVVDYRTDLYSLGVTFYEMLTGRLPFISEDPLELVHAHIAKNPTPPHHLRPEIPLIVSQIVMKLLAKNAEDRYQSAFGLKYDLEQCLIYLQDQTSADDLSALTFELARQDFSGRFQIPQKLYGRENEIETLLGAFERVASLPTSRNGQDGDEELAGEKTDLDASLNGRKAKQAELMMVAGYAGVGKSVLVHEVHKPITEKRGYFIEGKFDPFQRNSPYHAWAQAFKTWVNLLLTENETILAEWRTKILNAVGNIGQVLLEVIPNLELIIGPQPAVPELGGIEAQNRFNYLFQNFIKTIAQPEHPLVIFIDDWQWADPASLNLFKLLLSDTNLQSLLLIGAYRNNEVDPTHPFMLALEELRQTEVAINTIQLHNLSREHVQAVIADTLSSGAIAAGSTELQELSGLIYEKTLGNAFFVNEFLRSLYADGLLQFDFGTSSWSYDIAKIKALNITDNVVELLVGKVLKLPPATQIYLKLAACVGNQFDLATLAVIAEASPQEIQQNLIPALQEGVITLLPDLLDSTGSARYQFVHDRIQQAAYSLIPDYAKQELHLKIGRLLLQNIPLAEREERIFEIVNQLNFGLDLLDQSSDKKELAELNLTAGRRAKTATAYEPAFNYFQTGLNLLGADSWQTDYALTLALYSEAAETAYLTGSFEAMNHLTETILQRAANILDKVKAYEINISARGGQNQAAEAINAALECLEQLLGLTFPQAPTPADVQQGLQAMMTKLAGKNIEDLRDLPLMTDPHSQAAATILSLVGAVAYRTDIRLAILMSLKMMELSLTYGNTQVSPYAYASFGFVLCSVVQDIASGYRFGQLSLELVERLEAKAYHARTLMVIQPLIKHWQDPARETLPALLEMYQLGLETGDLQAAAIGIAYYASYAYFVGTELGEFARKIEPYREALRKYKQTTSLNKINLYLQIALNLANATDQPARLQGPIYHEDEMMAQHLAIRDSTTLCHHYLTRMTLNFLFEDYPQARADAASTAQYISAAAGQLLIPIFHFYDSLIHLANYPDVDETEQAAILARVTEHQQKMERWAKHAPANHSHKFYLVEAERYHILGEAKEAREYYDLALQTAKANGYLNEEALAAELAGKFYLSRGDTFLGEVYLRRAYQGYQHWGATAKVKQLETKYPYFVRSTFATTGQMSVSSTSTGQTTSQLLDLSTILKASQTLAGEVDLSQLLAQMIKLVVENAGAEQGFLLLEKDKAWYIEAEYHVQDQAVKVLQSIPLENEAGRNEPAQIPTEIINYVVAAKEVIVLNNAAVEGQFSRLPYMKKKQSKSVLCLPLLHQSKLAGVLYLENNLITGAFTPERVELLNLLSSQMAISIENARLYTDLQQSEKKYRTIFEDSRDMIFITTPTGAVIDVSPACFNLLGYTRDEMLHMNTREFYANPADRLKFRDEVETHGSVKDLELKFLRRDGTDIDVLLTASIWKAEDGNFLGYQGIVRDITAQKRAEQERLRLSVVDQELSLAKNIQQSLLPPPEPGWSDLEVVCYSQPAREVGGDLYAYYLLTSPSAGEESGERKYAIAVGDVTGKGMPAALLMAVSLASLSSTVRQVLPPHKLLAQLDTTLVDYTHLSSQNCALVYAEITHGIGGTTTKSLLRMSNAGCPTPIIKRANGSVEWVEIGGLPLGVGLGAEIGYPEAELNLSKGELLILTSDGVVEARNGDKEMFGFERLYHAIKSGPRTSAEVMLEFLKSEVARFVGNLEPHDDLTIVVIRV
jgi:PAS domain S-box-containing protein